MALRGVLIWRVYMMLVVLYDTFATVSPRIAGFVNVEPMKAEEQEQ